MTTKINVIGKVQGVAYRHYTKLKADVLGINGSVENLVNGSVIILCKGTSDQVEKLTSWCKTGSPAAKVNEVIISESNDNLQFNDFSILR